MKIKELLYKTPEMTEEKLLEIIDNEIPTLKRINRHLINKHFREESAYLRDGYILGRNCQNCC
jgi:hypothetical protein